MANLTPSPKMQYGYITCDQRLPDLIIATVCGETPKRNARSRPMPQYCGANLILRTSSSKSIDIPCFSPELLGIFKRLFNAASRMLSVFVPSHKCDGLQHFGLSQV